jgi:membrane associated rhomboid family serine protease
MSLGGGRLTPAVKYLIIVCGGMFLLQAISDRLGLGSWPRFFLALSPILVWKKFFFWQLGTYIFLHGSFFHLLFNLFAVWMFGSQLERKWGTKAFLKYFLVTGIGAGICYAIVKPGLGYPVVGASGAIYGILLAYAMVFPDQIVYIWFLFPMKARNFVILFGAIELYSSIMAPNAGIAHVAHLGGMLFGYFYMNYVRIFRKLYMVYLKYKLRRLRGHLYVVDPEKKKKKKEYYH